MNEYLPHRSLIRLLVVLALVVSPHLIHVPWWEALVVAVLLAWRAAASYRQWSLPPQALKLAMALAAVALVYLEYGQLSGQGPGIALLVMMLAMKLTEMRSRRDVMVVVFLMYFLLLTHFLISQEIWTIAYLLASAVAITMVLVDANHPREPLPLKASAMLGAKMVGQALPLMLLFFVLFPRIPGPLWGVPADSGSARTGLSDSMTPGDFAKLIQSREIAFRVTFSHRIPESHELYWRGPVLRTFEGRTWTMRRSDLTFSDPGSVQPRGKQVDYQITLEPLRGPWLFALDMPDPRKLPVNSRIGISGSLTSTKKGETRRQFDMVSHLDFALSKELREADRIRDTRLPLGWNPRTLALAADWRAQGYNDTQIVEAALRMFREQAFFYSLEPPRLGRHSSDEFLFETRKGFCEHYSSSFAILMRAAGIPARVVTGYQGMEANPLGDYFVVRQSDAHAWNEVWLQGRGWVRIDPTSVIPKGRIELSTELALADSFSRDLRGLSAFQRLGYVMEARWDLINARWNEWVLGYGPEIQQSFLSAFGVKDLRMMILALTVSVTLSLAVVGFYALRKAAPPPIKETSQKLWKKLTARLAKAGYSQRPDEGPRDFVGRVIAREPQLAGPLSSLLDAYLRLRYGEENSSELEKAMREALRKIPLPRRQMAIQNR